MNRNVVVILIVIASILALYFVSDNQSKKQQTQKAFEVYMDEPLNITGIDFTITNVKETKKIGKYKAKNTFLQTFITAKNTKSTRNYLPFTLALVNKQDDKWICPLDERFKNTLEKTEYLAGGYVLDPNEEIKASMVFNCDAYLNEKAGLRKSKPSDFKLFIYSKEKKDGGYIFLEKKPNGNQI